MSVDLCEGLLLGFLCCAKVFLCFVFYCVASDQNPKIVMWRAWFCVLFPLSFCQLFLLKSHDAHLFWWSAAILGSTSSQEVNRGSREVKHGPDCVIKCGLPGFPADFAYFKVPCEQFRRAASHSRCSFQFSIPEKPDLLPYHLIITSASGRWSYRLTKLQINSIETTDDTRQIVCQQYSIEQQKSICIRLNFAVVLKMYMYTISFPHRN